MNKPHNKSSAFDLDKAVSEWCRRFQSGGDLDDAVITELESHLRDEVEDRIRQGENPEAAFREATSSVEKAEAVGREYRKIHARNHRASRPGPVGGISLGLLLNSIKIAFRKMRRQKGYSLITVSGLALGIAASTLILIWVRHELSFDRFHKHSENIYRVLMSDPLNDGIAVHPWLPFPLGPALQNEFPEIAAVSRYRPDDMVVRYKDRAYTETAFLTVDSTFFTIFSFPFIQGNPAGALDEPHNIVIRDTMVAKYFNHEDPMGKTLNLSGRADLKISGIVHIPDESEFQFDFFFSFQAYPLFNVDLGPLESNWLGKNYQTYLRLHEGTSGSLLEKKIAGFLKTRTAGHTEILRLQKLSRIHLFKSDGSEGGMKYIRLFSLIAVFILIIACVNFMNLTTTRFERRARDMSLHKTLGGTRGQIIRPFFIESLLHTGLATAAALLLVEFALPTFNQITNRRLDLDLSHAGLVSGLLSIVLLAGFISGLYPSLFYSVFSPSGLSKSRSHPHGRGFLLRRFLVVFQFTLSTTLIIASLVVRSQISFIMDRDLGMDTENIVYHLMQKRTRDSVDVVREELLRHPDILNVASSSSLPSRMQSWIGYMDWEGRSPDQQIHPAFISVDPDFLETAGLEMTDGRNFLRSPPDGADDFIINETAARRLGTDNPIGLELRFWGQKGRVIGIVKDFTNRHMSFATAPVIMSNGDWGANRNFLLLRLRPGSPAHALQHFRQVWRRANPGFPCEYEFLDENFNRIYTNERRLSQILLSFTILAVVISGLGLMGLSAYTAQEKTKEIGIRKVLGASSWKILYLISSNFVKLIIIANVIAWPTACLFMHRWLQSFEYRTSVGIGLLALSGCLGLIIALLSVGHQTFRAAAANPVESLRYE